VTAENTSRAAIVFNIERADLYVAAGDFEGAVDCLEDASTQAVQEDEMGLLKQISDKIGQLIQEENKQLEEESEAEESEENVGPRRMKYEDERAYIEERADLHKLEGELERYSIIMKSENGSSLNALAHLIVELKDQIPHYDTILSDDASGRLISLLFRDIIKEKRDEQKTEPLQTYFIAGGRGSRRAGDDEINKFIEDRKAKLGRTLLVTEYIDSGMSIGELIDILEKQGIDFDVATVSISDPIYAYNEKIQKHLYYGTVGKEGLNFYGEQKFAGVKKPVTGEYKKGPHPVSVFDNIDTWVVDDHTHISQARKDVKIVAEELSKLVDSPKQEPNSI
jgi:hypothetical protein